MIEQGTYKARGVSGALGMTGTGKEQVAIELEILEGEPKGQRVTWHGYFTDATFDRTIESLRLLGWQGTDLSDLSGVGLNEVSIVIEHEQYDGKTRARVQWINAVGGIALKERLDPGQAAAFAARMKGKILALGQAAANTPTPHDPPRGVGVGGPMNDSGDIPFARNESACVLGEGIGESWHPSRQRII